MTSLTRLSVLCVLLLGQVAAAQQLQFIDPSTGDYRLAKVFGVEMYGEVWNVQFYNNAPYDAVPPSDRVGQDFLVPTVEVINSIAAHLPSDVARTYSIYFPAGTEEAPDGERERLIVRNVNVSQDESLLLYDLSTQDLSYGIQQDATMPFEVAWPSAVLTLPGDANFDGLFMSDDLIWIISNGLYETDQPATWTQGDFTRDGLFNSSDLIAALATGQYEQPAAAMSVPEPSSLVLAIAGLLLCRVKRFFRRRD